MRYRRGVRSLSLRVHLPLSPINLAVTSSSHSHTKSLVSFHSIFPPNSSSKSKMGTATFVDIIVAILLPPLGVFLKFGCGAEFWICLLLTLFGYIPGIIYAIYIITK